jgi:hypothetical protein
MAKSIPKRELITYCGLYCGDCPGCKGTIADRARDLKAELEREDFRRAAEFFATDPSMSVFGKYPSFKEFLDVLENLHCPQTCRARAEHQCEVVNCCREKGLEGCWECDEFEACGKLRKDILATLHRGKNIENLRVLKNDGPQAFLTGKRFWFGKEKRN